jgi:hypothetical protein
MFKRSSSFWKVAATTSPAQASESCNKTSSSKLLDCNSNKLLKASGLRQIQALESFWTATTRSSSFSRLHTQVESSQASDPA